MFNIEIVLNINIFYKKRTKSYIIRPLLSLTRLEILQLCFFWKLPIYFDSTNRLMNFRRNRLRFQVFPILKIFFNPKIEVSLVRFISTIDFDDYYFNQQVCEFSNFFKKRELNLSNFKKMEKIKNWISYLPNNLQQKFYQRLLFFYCKSLSFNEIRLLFNLKNINF